MAFFVFSLALLCLAVFMEDKAILKSREGGDSASLFVRLVRALRLVFVPYSFPRWWLAISLSLVIPLMSIFLWREIVFWVPWTVILFLVFLVSIPSFSYAELEKKRSEIHEDRE
ncbi:hypothetical protein ACFVWN_18765 [Nocardiopsis flavescens]|uniref:hypothetical protein n=1 Tax=Nocardiopsis flavescens TaxID=758803 RepID=UPI00365BB1BA